MKKRISLFIATVFTIVALPVAAFAEGGVTFINGHVLSNGSPTAGADVSVVCNGNTQTAGPTLANGLYAVVFNPASDCPAGDTATVTATKGSASGSKTGLVGNAGGTTINTAIIDVSVPEFGMVAGISAAILGGGAFMVMRRRQLGQN